MSLSSMPTPKYEYVTSSERAKVILSELENYDVLAVDTETTSLDVFEAKLALVQIAAGDNNFVFDTRYDTEHSDVHPSLFVPCFTNNNIVKILQNANYDTKIFKKATGEFIQNVYDTMIVEQLLNLGLPTRAGLRTLVERYLFMDMPKEPAKTFADYGQVYRPFQLEYAINDVVPLDLIRKVQTKDLIHEGLMDVAQLEFDFIKPLSQMELNGVKIDIDKWRIMLEDITPEKASLSSDIIAILSEMDDQTTLFGAHSINIDSQKQLLKALRRYGLSELESTDVEALSNFVSVPVVKSILEYRALNKILGTYGETLLDKINPKTGRLHTQFKQLISTGRLSSSNPNLQNIPSKQKYRSGFIAEDGYTMLTADMAGAELRILGNLSLDPIFVSSYAKGLDLHKVAASMVFGVDYDKVLSSQRKAVKAIQFGLCYGLSKFGLARDLKIKEREAQNMIQNYFHNYKGIKVFLDNSAAFGLNNLYTRSVSGRKRYYHLPPHYDEDFNKISGMIRRRAMNHPIQGSNADTIKKSMIYLSDRLEKGGYDARLILTVHDEIVTECVNEQAEEVSAIVRDSIIDGFGHYFHTIPMETDVVVGPCWVKGACEYEHSEGNKCGGTHSEFVADAKYKTKLVCKKCGNAL